MKCSLLTLSCALDGELSRERQAELDSHLITCERCRTGMRYLREETERISLLAPVRLSEDKATALLERSRVLVPVSDDPGPPVPEQSDSASLAPARIAPDPFGTMGLGAAIVNVPGSPEPTGTSALAQEAARDESEPAESGPARAELERGSAFEAEEADLAAADATSAAPEAMWLGDAPEEAYVGDAPAAEDEMADGPAPGETPGADLDPPAPPALGDNLSPPSPSAELAASDALAAVPEAMWLADAPDAPHLGSASIAEDDPGGETHGEVTGADSDPPADREPGGQDLAASDALQAIPEAMWLANAPENPGSGDLLSGSGDGAGDQDEVAFGDGKANTPDTAGDEPASASLSDPSTEAGPGSVVVPGWEPATELPMPWGDIPAATPSPTTWAPDAARVPGLRGSTLPPAAPFPATPPPARPAAAAISGLQTDRETRRPAARGNQRRGAGSGFRRPSLPRGGPGGSETRSWNRTGLIAVAAVAAVLILWNFTHGGAAPTGSHRSSGRATPTASPHPTPSARPTPSATPTPLALTGVQTVGSTGSGYQVQTVRYGVHGSQFWVVFQMVQGSGAPQVTAGFDGPQTIYLEMQGVAPGTAVPQPAPGTVVGSVTVGQVAGFSGAVYVLHLTRAVQLSPSELAGTDTGGAGERYLAILQ